jgi:hypothetical protein
MFNIYCCMPSFLIKQTFFVFIRRILNFSLAQFKLLNMLRLLNSSFRRFFSRKNSIIGSKFINLLSLSLNISVWSIKSIYTSSIWRRRIRIWTLFTILQVAEPIYRVITYIMLWFGTINERSDTWASANWTWISIAILFS